MSELLRADQREHEVREQQDGESGRRGHTRLPGRSWARLPAGRLSSRRPQTSKAITAHNRAAPTRNTMSISLSKQSKRCGRVWNHEPETVRKEGVRGHQKSVNKLRISVGRDLPSSCNEVLRPVRSDDFSSACCVRMSCAPSRVNLAGSRPSRTGDSPREICLFLSTPQWPIRWPAPTRGDRSSLFRCSADTDLGCVGPCRNAVAAVTVLGPCVLLLQDHTHSGLVFVVIGEGTAALRTASGFFAATVQTDKFPRPAVFLARQISRVLPVLHCVAAPPLRFGVRRARHRAVRFTPRPRWARPG